VHGFTSWQGAVRPSDCLVSTPDFGGQHGASCLKEAWEILLLALVPWYGYQNYRTGLPTVRPPLSSPREAKAEGRVLRDSVSAGAALLTPDFGWLEAQDGTILLGIVKRWKDRQMTGQAAGLMHAICLNFLPLVAATNSHPIPRRTAQSEFTFNIASLPAQLAESCIATASYSCAAKRRCDAVIGIRNESISLAGYERDRLRDTVRSSVRMRNSRCTWRCGLSLEGRHRG
jgi:hypothetical protein